MRDFPDLGDRARFPPFLALPEDGGDARNATDGDADVDAGPAPVLLAQIKDNMTITKPTLVLTDRDGHPFALVFDGVGHDGLDLGRCGLKKGATAVVHGARRSIPAAAAAPLDGTPETLTSKAAKRPFVRIAPGRAHTVQAVPASLEQTLAAAAKLHGRRRPDGDDAEIRCDACGAVGSREATTVGAAKRLLKCTGCGEAWYCDRACQTKGWADGHKSECKALRGLSLIWGDAAQ